VTFEVKNSLSCILLRPPYGTVLPEDVNEDGIVIRDLDFNGCSYGDLYASFYLWRGIKDQTTGKFTNQFVTNKLDLYLGELGCDSTCLACNGNTALDCTLCADYNNAYLYEG